MNTLKQTKRATPHALRLRHPLNIWTNEAKRPTQLPQPRLLSPKAEPPVVQARGQAGNNLVRLASLDFEKAA